MCRLLAIQPPNGCIHHRCKAAAPWPTVGIYCRSKQALKKVVLRQGSLNSHLLSKSLFQGDALVMAFAPIEP